MNSKENGVGGGGDEVADNETLSKAFLTLVENAHDEQYWGRFSHEEAIQAYLLVATGAQGSMQRATQMMGIIRDLVVELRFAGLDEWADRIESDVFAFMGWDSWETWDFAMIRDSLEDPGAPGS